MFDEAVIKTNKLKKTFAGREVIKDCNMTVQKGSIYGLLGANGAGKTTIFKMLMGLLQPTAGSIEILGMDISTNRNEILRNIGSIIEVPAFYDHLSASENLEIHLSYMGTSGSKIGEVLKLVGLNQSNNQPVSQYSLGMRQRLGIARALAHSPQLLILDEPINGLDPIGFRELRELFLSLVNETQMTILISSHILSEMEYIADTIGVIAEGVLVKELSMSAIREQFPDGLEEYFLTIHERR